MYIPAFLSAAALLAGLVVAHPGHDHTEELKAQNEFFANNKRDLSHCAEKLRARGVHAANIKRRSALASKMLKKRGLQGKVHRLVR